MCVRERGREIERERGEDLCCSLQHMHKLDSRMRTVSDPFFNQTVRERAQQRGKVAAGYGKRAESSEDVWRGEGGWGGGGGDDVDSNEPVLPERRYSPA